MTDASTEAGKDCSGKTSTVDEMFLVLQKANRSADQNYIAEVLKV